jgi:predicted NAD-dependent protein-ADP-ribosyltransferase YbiA (DUF1768 family)
MDITTKFYKDIGLFGSYPNSDDISLLEEYGIELFVNLTTKDENLPPYITSKNLINFPILDTRIPNDNLQFVMLILLIEDYLQDNQKVYIHCRGGHGRSALIAASVLCKMEKISTDEAIQIITENHKNRVRMNPKYRDCICPNSKIQRFYLRKIFEPLYFSKCLKNSQKNGFSNYSLHQVEIPNLGVFPNSEAAFQALRNIKNKDYISTLMRCKNPHISRLIGEKYTLIYGDFDLETKLSYMEYILKLKFSQNPDLRIKLLMTGFRPIVNHNRYDDFWADGNGCGYNYLGKILEKIRDEYYYC